MREQNLRALASRDAALASRAGSAAPDPRIQVRLSRNGQPVPCIIEEGRARALHSLADPVREGERLAATVAQAGYVVALGLGGGYHLRPLLAREDLAVLLVVEKDPAVLSALCAGCDLRGILDDPRVTVLLGEPPSTLEALIPASWAPLIAGSLATLPLRVWTQAERAFFEPAAEAVRAAAEASRGDLATQARFARRWFSNMLGNLPRAETSRFDLPVPAAVVVTAAGPSLEENLPTVARRLPDSLVLATDTSLPALASAGIAPQAVLSIDCQVHSLNHFRQGLPEGTTILLDLASPPLLARRFARHAFVASAHPFARLLARRWKPFPGVDMRGGSVTHACVSLADSLGASRILVVGADFSYPRGKPYARGTWLYDHFGCRSSRLAPIESSMCSLVFSTGEPALRERVGGALRYTTPLLLAYKRSLEHLCEGAEAEISAVKGTGLTLDLGQARPASSRRRGEGEPGCEPWRAGRPRCTWQEFLRLFAHELAGLPEARPPLGRWFASLAEEERELWETVLPVAAALLRDTRRQGPAGSGSDAGALPARAAAAGLDRARAWMIDRISRALSEDDARVADE